MKIIINADDFGKSHEVNVAICECFKQALINRTTLMVNMPFSDEAVEMAKIYNFFDRVGLHINLTEGKPLTKECRESKLCDIDDRFTAAYHKGITRFLVPEAIRRVIALEVEAQINKYLNHGFTLMHLDSHHHIHTDYSVFRAIKPLIEQYNFTSVRISRNIPPNSTSVAKKYYKSLYNGMLLKLKCQNRRNIVSTNYFGTKADFIKWYSPGIIRNETVELSVHPRYCNGIILDTNEKIYDQKWLMDNELELQ